MTLRNLILDMDGVLWRGETPMPGLVPFFELLRRLEMGCVLATNNATKTATQYVEKLARFGVEVAPEAILTSAEATAAYLGEEYPPGTEAYVVGEKGLRLALEAKGFRLLPANGIVPREVSAPLVVVGFTRLATYDQLASAALLIREGARFVGTNPDKTFPAERGQLPGAGSILAFLEAATGKEPLVIGKPGAVIFKEALRRLGGKPEETAMVGDRLETDIAGAQAAGLRTILLLSGVTDRQRLAQSSMRPDRVLEDIQELAVFLGETGAKGG